MTKRQKWEQIKANYPDIAEFRRQGERAGLTFGKPRIYMKQRSILNQEQLEKASKDLLLLAGHLPVVITITEGSKIRTEGQNARYWASIDEFMREMEEATQKLSDYTGYSYWEAKREIANYLPAEQVQVLYANHDKAVHKALKQICNIPTSTRLGTKEFSAFDDTLHRTMIEIINEINAFYREAVA